MLQKIEAEEENLKGRQTAALSEKMAFPSRKCQGGRSNRSGQPALSGHSSCWTVPCSRDLPGHSSL